MLKVHVQAKIKGEEQALTQRRSGLLDLDSELLESNPELLLSDPEARADGIGLDIFPCLISFTTDHRSPMPKVDQLCMKLHF